MSMFIVYYCCLQEHHLALRSEGIKMIVDSQRPHFVGVDPDILSTGLVFYYLKVDKEVFMLYYKVARKFGSSADRPIYCKIKIRQNFFRTYICMMIPYCTAKIKFCQFSKSYI